MKNADVDVSHHILNVYELHHSDKKKQPSALDNVQHMDAGPKQ